MLLVVPPPLAVLLAALVPVVAALDWTCLDRSLLVDRENVDDPPPLESLSLVEVVPPLEVAKESFPPPASAVPAAVPAPGMRRMVMMLIMVTLTLVTLVTTLLTLTMLMLMTLLLLPVAIIVPIREFEWIVHVHEIVCSIPIDIDSIHEWFPVESFVEPSAVVEHQ